jgi:hypothetical protein
MATVNLSPLFNAITNFDQYGNIIANGMIYTYQAGSSTPFATYTDSSGVVANTNPIVLGPDGKLQNELWLQAGFDYKFILTDANNNVIDTYDNIGGIVTTTSGGSSSLPSGCILIWSGPVGAIPSGFVLCDGTTAGVPDLRNSFVIGAGSNYTVGQTGGSADSIVVSHSHAASATITDPGHTHTYSAFIPGSGYEAGLTGANPYIGGTSGTTESSTTGISASISVQTAGQSGTGGNLPPYYALAYIYKL